MTSVGAKKKITTPIDYSGHITIRGADFSSDEDEDDEEGDVGGVDGTQPNDGNRGHDRDRGHDRPVAARAMTTGAMLVATEYPNDQMAPWGL